MPTDPPPPQHAPQRRGSSTRRAVERVAVGPEGVRRARRRDHLATEEPLEIRAVQGEAALPTVVSMRTPGADFELAAGYLYAEGVVQGAGEIRSIRYCVGSDADEAQQYNAVRVQLAEGALVDAARLARAQAISSACGVCGKRSIDEALRGVGEVSGGRVRVSAETLLALPERLRAAQRVFRRTGGLHAMALFDAGGELLRVREDVGRHNAMDKLLGAALLAGELPLAERVVLASGRLSFELVQKAVRAGVPVLAGVSAPSSLAVEMAERAGLTLVGFLREGGFNVYTGGERITTGAAPAAEPATAREAR